MDHDKRGAKAHPRSGLCINNCGFLGSCTMNMCSKCHKTMLFQQELGAKLASAPMAVSVQPSSVQAVAEVVAPAAKPKEGPSRCTTCNKRVGLTRFKCRCGDLFCSFKYHVAAQEAISKANEVAKADPMCW
ncbi:hypothetical protein Bca52824_095804 [Brassica carinata]|uniref:A20-type domain-containing protein n=1 Tax=Brassica carinata TaxID=52824 RepID=A0A8X7P115_BRACI|nr:hypothetical protein Bca52824_095804 [Brassica carinata]